MKIYSAPLQGFTEAPWRTAHQAVFGGVDAYYAPFVRLEKEGIRKKDRRDLSGAANDSIRLIPQLIAATPDEMKSLIDFIAGLGWHEIDINLGCPFPPIALRHRGSGILPYPDEAAALLRVVAEYPDLQFSVKMRPGYVSSDEWKALLPMLNETRLERIVMHPRIGKLQYKGIPDQEVFAEFYEAVKHPLVYNGDLHTTDEIDSIIGMFPDLEGIMLGRGLLARPSLASEYQSGETLSDQELYAKVLEMHNRLLTHYSEALEGGEAQLLNKMKTLWEYLLPDLDKKVHKMIRKSTSMQKYLSAINQIY